MEKAIEQIGRAVGEIHRNLLLLLDDHKPLNDRQQKALEWAMEKLTDWEIECLHSLSEVFL